MTAGMAPPVAVHGVHLPAAAQASAAQLWSGLASQTATLTWAALWGYVALCGVWSLRHLQTDSARHYALARAASDCTVCSALLVTVSGMCWAQLLRGNLWAWDPGLTAGLLALLVAGSVALLAGSLPNRAVECRYVAALGVFAAANLPFVHYASTLWGKRHAPPGDLLFAAQGTTASWTLAVVAGLLLLALRARARLKQACQAEPRENTPA